MLFFAASVDIPLVAAGFPLRFFEDAEQVFSADEAERDDARTDV
jgi:hypothetical protein